MTCWNSSLVYNSSYVTTCQIHYLKASWLTDSSWAFAIGSSTGSFEDFRSIFYRHFAIRVIYILFIILFQSFELQVYCPRRPWSVPVQARIGWSFWRGSLMGNHLGSSSQMSILVGTCGEMLARIGYRRHIFLLWVLSVRWLIWFRLFFYDLATWITLSPPPFYRTVELYTSPSSSNSHDVSGNSGGIDNL